MRLMYLDNTSHNSARARKNLERKEKDDILELLCCI